MSRATRATVRLVLGRPTLELLALAACLGLSACATPGVLRKPPDAPSMAQPVQGNPTPAYATPDPSPPAPAHDQSPGIN